MRFASWPFLFLLLLIPLLWKVWLERSRPPRVHYPVSLTGIGARKNPIRILLILKILTWTAFVIALARPQSSFRQTERTVSGVDIMMVLDMSASMNIEDMGEHSRLDLAKQTMGGFIEGRKNDRIGLVTFSGEAITLSPPTLDYKLVMNGLVQAEIGELKDGTAIGDGLSVAVARLKNSIAKSKVIILLTDGDNNVGQVDPATAGDLAAGFGIKVYTIAIGSEGRVKVPIKRRGMFGNVVTTYQWMDNALNPELLKQIAQVTNGKFFRVQDEKVLEGVFEQIDRLEKSEVKSTEKVRYEEEFQKPMKLGFVFMLAEKILSHAWWRFLP